MTAVKEPFECMNPDRYRIRGYEIHKEGQEGVLPAVICCHGFTSDMRETIPYGEVIAEEGYRAFVFDFCGGCLCGTSEGSLEDYMTTDTEKGDLKAVLSYVQSRKDTDSAKIAIMGGSQGGFITSITAPEQKELSGILLMYPAMCIPDDARRGSMQIMQFDPDNIPDHIGVRPMYISGEFPRIAQKIHLEQALTGYKGPVLLLHGTVDSIVPVSYASDTYEIYRKNGNDITFELFEGCDHGFHREFFPIACDRMKKFLKHIF